MPTTPAQATRSTSNTSPTSPKRAQPIPFVSRHAITSPRSSPPLDFLMDDDPFANLTASRPSNKSGIPPRSPLVDLECDGIGTSFYVSDL